jgi:hypothetical protein
MIAEAAPKAACALTTTTSFGTLTTSRQPRPTMSPEITTKSRFARTESTSNPAGIWKIAAVIELAAMAIPISPDCQCSPPFKKTER